MLRPSRSLTADSNGASAAPRPIDAAAVEAWLAGVPEHPRLLLRAGDVAATRAGIAEEPALARYWAELLADADRELGSQPVERVLTGIRLLHVSREALARTVKLALAWRLTGRAAYAERARAELLAVAAFPDWNPAHFLDVAEMTAAVAIGFDWLHAALDEATRETLRAAIVEKGLRPSLEHDAWSRRVNNWNQVCNGGMVLGALAVAEHERALAAEMIARAVNTLPLAMASYAPDGAYPEGPDYWEYGTSFNVLAIAALEGALGTDFGLAARSGFLASADFCLHATGGSGLSFNYGDGPRKPRRLSPTMFWFAARRDAPWLLWQEWPRLAPGVGDGRDRLDPLLLVWGAGLRGRPPEPPARHWCGAGVMPVAFHRSGWDEGATFAAIKGGSPAIDHAHMDVGTFVMDADGVRWADDLGRQDYHSLESRGYPLWGLEQDSPRWRIFRCGPACHNILQVDGRPQGATGRAEFTRHAADRSVVDLTALYAGQLAEVRRGLRLAADGVVRVQDEFTAGATAATVRWAMLTFADVRVERPGEATLSQGGRTLRLRVVEPVGAGLGLAVTDPPPSDFDAPNPGSRMIVFETRLQPGERARSVVDLRPGRVAEAAGEAVTALAEW